jgi:hypothetical protein
MVGEKETSVEEAYRVSIQKQIKADTVHIHVYQNRREIHR